MRICYIRVSTVEQNDQRQRDAFEKLNIDKYFIEKASGKDMESRPQLRAMLDFAREQDIIFVHDLSRLARNLKDLLEILEILEKKQITLISNKENIDTSTPTGKLMIAMIGAINEFERSILKERQLEGIAVAKAAGKYTGRKRIEKPANWDEVISLYMTRAISGKVAQQRLGLKPNVFHNFIKAEALKSLSEPEQSIGERV